MLKNYQIGYFLMSEKFENFSVAEGPEFKKSCMDISCFSTTGSLFLRILNNYDAIISALSLCKITDENKISSTLANLKDILLKHDNDIAIIIYVELLRYYEKHGSDYWAIASKLNTVDELIESENNKSLLKDLKDLQKQFNKEMSNLKDWVESMNEYIDNLIKELTAYKTCFDLYFIKKEKIDFTTLDKSILHDLSNLKIELPRHEILLAKNNNEQVVFANSLLFPAYVRSSTHLYDYTMAEDEVPNKSLNSNNEFFMNEYEVYSIIDILNIYLGCLLNYNITINKCKNCGKYFIPANRTDEKYCDNPSPEKPNKTCKEYGVKKMYSESVASDPIKNEHYRTSQFYRVRISRAMKKGNTKFANKMSDLLTKYQTNYEKMLAKYNKKKLSESDFITWIIDQKKD